VAEGNGEFLRPGLPWQAVHDGERLAHEPLRRSVCVEAPQEAMIGVLRRHEGVWALFDNCWLHLLAVDETRRLRSSEGPWPGGAPGPDGDSRACLIVTTPHVAALARMMARVLREEGFSTEIAADTRDATRFGHRFVLCPQMFDPLPEGYVAVQMAQSVSPRWFTPDYLWRLGQARAVLDYSPQNLEALEAGGVGAGSCSMCRSTWSAAAWGSSATPWDGAARFSTGTRTAPDGGRSSHGCVARCRSSRW
jgi:hypothetical protein